MTQNSVNCLVKCTLIKLDFLLLNVFTKIDRNEILHVQCITLIAVITFLKLTAKFKSKHPL
jgi:hypothetical protein